MVMRIPRIALSAAMLFAALTGVNSQAPPITPSDVMAANEECGTAEAAAISASWTRDQTVAALNAVSGPMMLTAYLSNDPATIAAWQALKAASEANVSGATGTVKDLQDIADDKCKLAQGLIQRSHVEIKDLPGGAFVGIDLQPRCSPARRGAPGGGCHTDSYTFSTVLSQSATTNSVSTGGAACVYTVGPIHPDQVQFTSASIVEQARNGIFEQTGSFAFKYQPNPSFKGVDEYAIKVCGHNNQRAGCATVTYRVTVK
jgi:hypothetical protein